LEQPTSSTSPIPFTGKDWFDPLEDAIRIRIRAFIEALVEEAAQAALGGRLRYQRKGGPAKGYRNGHRPQQLVGTFGALTVSLPRVRLRDGDGGETEWRSQSVQAHKPLTKRAEALIAKLLTAPSSRPACSPATQSSGQPRPSCGSQPATDLIVATYSYMQLV